MGEWLVRLKGHEFDLLDLADLFERTPVSVVKDQDYYYLKSDSFQRFTDVEQCDDVLKAANELMPTLLGIGKVRLSKRLSVQVDAAVVRIEDDGTRHSIVMLGGPLEMRARVRAVFALSGETGKPPQPPPSPIETLLNMAQTDPMVATALRHFSQPEHRWSNLFKVLDTIETDVAARTRVKLEKAIPNQGWATGTVLEKFTANANHAGVHGDEARHGIRPWRPLRASKVMPIEEAEALIGHVLTEWLEWRKQQADQ